MTHWFTADLHLGDEGIMRYFGRPFRNIAEMNNTMLDAMATRLKDGDDLWVLGDVADTSSGGEELARTLIERLPGRKHLIRGNHDDATITRLPWTSQHELTEVQDGPERFVLGVVCGRGRNPTLRFWPTIFSGEVDVLPSEGRDVSQEIGR